MELKTIEGFENYLITSDGRVFSKITDRFLKERFTEKGYQIVDLYSGGERRVKKVHRLVLEAFVGYSDLAVNHIDGDKGNNSLCNLEYVTNKQNSEHALELGLVKTKPIILHNPILGRLREFNSQSEAAKYLGVHSFKVSDLYLGYTQDIDGWTLW